MQACTVPNARQPIINVGQPISSWRVQTDLAHLDQMLTAPDAGPNNRLFCGTTSAAGCEPISGVCTSSKRDASSNAGSRFARLPEAAETAVGAGFEVALEFAFGQMKTYLLAAHRAAKPPVAIDTQRPSQNVLVAPPMLVNQVPASEHASQVPLNDILREQLRIQVQLAEVCKIVQETASPNTLAETSGAQPMNFDTSEQLADPPAEAQKDTEGTKGTEKKSTRESIERRNKETLDQYDVQQSWGQLAMDFAPAIVIMLNSVVIGLSSDIDPDSSFWEVVEVFFTVFFTSELLIKLKLFGCKEFFLGPDMAWNWFDVFCAGTALSELAFTVYVLLFAGDSGINLSSLLLIKMLRLARIMRLVRLLRFKVFAELKKIVQGVVSGIRVLGWAILLLLFVIFVLGIIYRKLLGEAEEEFSTVPHAMFTLFRCFTEGCAAYDGTPLTERLFMNHGAMFVIPYALVYLFVTFGIFNLIMAVFIENVSTEQHSTKLNEIGDNAAYTRARLERVLIFLFHGEKIDQETFWAGVLDRFHTFPLVSKIITSIIGPITKETGSSDLQIVSREIFETWTENPIFLALLEDIDIETANKHELFDVLDVNMDGVLSMSEVVDGLMRLRGAVTKSDIVAIRMKIRYMTGMIDEMGLQVQEVHTNSARAGCNKSETKASAKKALTAPLS